MYKTKSKNLQRGEGRIRELSEEAKEYEQRKFNKNANKFCTIASARKGKIVRAKVVSISEHGAFVDVNGVGGFIHISELSYKKIDNTCNELRIGSVYDMKIIEVGFNKNGILSLKLSRLLNKPLKTDCSIISKPNTFTNNPFADLKTLISNSK